MIYHEGSRYQVERVQVPTGDANQPGSVLTTEMRRCLECGYWHDRGMLVSDCQFCDAALPDSTVDLMQLRTVFTRRRERISSDEEERRRAGFDLQISYRFADRGAGRDSIEASATDVDGQPLLELVYGDAATIRMANMGRRRRASGVDGFLLDAVKGKWLPESHGSKKKSTTGDSQIDDRRRRQNHPPCHPLCGGHPQRVGHPSYQAIRCGAGHHSAHRTGTRHRGGIPTRGQRTGIPNAARPCRARPGTVHGGQ